MAHHGHKFDPSMRDHLLEPKRARYLPAREILSKFPLKAGGAAVDIGSGPGYWTIPMAELLGPLGRVYAVDLSEETIVRGRTTRPTTGWRGAIYTASNGRVNPGISEGEAARNVLLRRIRRHLRKGS